MYLKSSDEIKMLKKMYPRGTRLVLDFMLDDQSPPIGTIGTVVGVDDIGQIHMKWDNGSSLAINVDLDAFHILKNKSKED